MRAVDAAPYVRVTVVGGRRNADLVLPTAQAAAHLMPAVLDIVGATDDTMTYTLATTDGRVVDGAATLVDSGVRDGEILTLVAQAEVPSTPLVYDVVEVVDASTPWGTWSERARRQVLSALAALVLVSGAALAVWTWPAEAFRVWAVSALLAGAVSAVASSWRRTEAAWAFGAATVLMTGCAVATMEPPRTRWGWMGVVTLAFAVVVGVVGWCRRQALPTLGALGVLAAAATEALVLGLFVRDAASVAAVVAATVVLGVGMLPRLALESSGVFALDTAVTSGVRVAKRDATAAVAEAHALLLGATIVSAVVLLVSLASVAATRTDVWGITLSLVLTLATALRARHFPLAIERFVLWAAAVGGGIGLAVGLLTAWPDWRLSVLLLCGVTVAALLAAGHTRPTDLRTAQVRRVASVVENLTLLSVVPLLVGFFGVYADLLSSFS